MINFIKNEQFKFIWYTIPIVIGITLIKRNHTLDIQIHDTYFVFASFHIGVLWAIYLGIVGGIYWLTRNKKLIDWMTIMQVFITIIIILGILIFMIKPYEAIHASKPHYIPFDNYNRLYQVLLIGSLIFIFIQMTFLINVVWSLIRNQKKENK